MYVRGCMYACVYVCACMYTRACCGWFLLVGWLFGWVFNLLGAFYIWGACLYLRGFDGLGLFAFGFLYCFFDFMLLGCFFDFLGVLIFGFFDGFLMIFGFFYDFFSGLLNWFYSPKRVLFLKFSCNSFFLGYNVRRNDEVTRRSHRLKFTASSLVFNRICKSIKKYKTWWLVFCRLSMFTGCILDFLRFYLISYGKLMSPYGKNLMSLVTCKTWVF